MEYSIPMLDGMCLYPAGAQAKGGGGIQRFAKNYRSKRTAILALNPN
jgi:hypothetical protein